MPGATNHYRTRNINVPCNILHVNVFNCFFMLRHGHVICYVIVTSHIWPIIYTCKTYLLTVNYWFGVPGIVFYMEVLEAHFTMLRYNNVTNFYPSRDMSRYEFLPKNSKIM